MDFNIDDYSSFYNVKVVNVNKFERVRHLTYEYRDYEIGYLIEEDAFVSSDNKLFFHLYDAIQYEYNIDLCKEPLIYI